MTDKQRQRNRVIALGLDGVPFSFLERLMEEGHVPFLRSLAESGSFGCMESTKFPLSAVAWSSAYSGMNPARIGACGFVRKRRHSYLWEYVNPEESRGEDIWKILGEQGFKSVLIGPLFYTVRSDFVGSYIGGEEVGNQDNPYTVEDLGQETVDELVDKMRHKFAIATQTLSAAQEWDFAFIGFLEPDTMHAWYHCSDYDRLVEGYKAFDQLLERFLHEMSFPQDVSVILFSDHGNRPYDRAFHVNSWLYDNGYLHLLPWRRRVRYRMSEMHRGLRKVIGQGSRLLAPLYAGLYVARTIVRSFPSVRKHLLRFAPQLQLPANAKPQLDLQQKEQLTIDPGILFDYSRTTAFASLNHGGNLGGIFLNREREPCGVVADEDYEAVREQLANDLLATRERNSGIALIKNVWFREDVYAGPYIDDFPDIVFETDDRYFTYISEDDISNNNVTFRFRNCQHEMNGMVICNGPVFRQTPGFKCNLWDAAPTILAALGADVPPMDGRVLDLFEQTFGAVDNDTTGDPRLCQSP